jgi:branched-subunit amino acid aminotransferase/4-amino-4-deoxychorismate lyase
MLDGITKQLLERAGPTLGIPMRDRPIHLSEVDTMEGAFVSSARGIGLVSAVDDLELDTPPAGVEALVEAYASIPWGDI